MSANTLRQNSAQSPQRTIADVLASYRAGSLTPGKLIGDLLTQIDHADRDEVWISRVPAKTLKQQAAALDLMLQIKGEAVFESLPLFGIPFAVKDNIDVADMSTTAACPEFSHVPKVSATVVARLQQAGALLVGKTNLDQFATGLVGVRSPYGAVRNSLRPEYVSGGSSSGSAVAVALGQVLFSLGTDTAGSGRVPAAFNNLVGLKPTRGLLSASGMLPACRTLDCISIFAHDVADAWRVLQSAAGFDAGDAYSRSPLMLGVKRRGYRIAVPQKPEFYGDDNARLAYEQALEKITAMPGVSITHIPFDAFTDAAQLLYQGPWVAERRAALGAFFESHKEAIHPVVREITEQSDKFDAVDAFNGQYRLAELRREAETLLQNTDLLLVPTTTTMPTIAAVEADPIVRNSQLGYYTNFVNLMDMAALAIPAVWRKDGLPAGITLIGPAGSDHLLAEAGAQFQQLLGGAAQADAVAAAPLPFNEPTVKVGVVGAHLSGQPLNWQLLEAGARLHASTTTSKHYRLYALANTTPAKPGLVRTNGDDGAAIVSEVWEMPLRNFGSFVAAIPAPLGIGTMELADGSSVKGFICEPAALDNARDITGYGSWTAYLAAKI
ncbi:allophanate hydrolase [Herbaspirillum sp. meg3]|uniref:allophanate hydrolase n=1 Tax=Herbaspirillum sp. meg3 TaxID=2025949 RepID=UPI000B99C2B1|nr:allophanate hydrolase [Herbaspirillum sp. meg3]ASU38029.1 allophanate hydrolase [Herbaspirillum sp. meg3]